MSTEATGSLLRVNTEGVSNVLDLAADLRCPRLVHVSTAYVEKDHGGAVFRTDYERTKIEGERILARRAAERGVRTTVLRPSIVTGDQVYGFTPTFNGIYPFFRFAAEYWPVLRTMAPAHWLPTHFYANMAVNLVPGDVVAEAVRALAETPSGDEPRSFTLINPVDWVTRDLVGVVADYLRSRLPALDRAATEADSSTARRKGRMLFGVYEPYVGARPRLAADSQNALERIPHLPRFANRPEWIHALLDWCVRQHWEEVA